MPKLAFDSSIYIGRPRQIVLTQNNSMSVVVLQELVAGAADNSEVKLLDAARHNYQKAELLLVPNAEDWWLAGKVVNALQRGLKSQRGGLTPKLASAEKTRIIHDVLIARTARRAGVTVVTDNVKDFEAIQKFCFVKIISGNDYFGD